MNEKNNQESGKAGKPGEITADAGARAQGAQATGAEASSDASKAKDLRSAEGIASLLKSEFASVDTAEAAGGEEVQPATQQAAATDSADAGLAANAADGEQQEEQQAEQSAENEGAQAEGSEEQAGEETAGAEQLPPELQNAIRDWEERGKGELPPVLQSLVDRRINKLTSQRETEKSAREAAEAKVTELNAEVARLQAVQQGGAPVSGGQLPDEKTLAERERSFEQFLSDAESFLDDTANEAERGRIQRLMQDNGLDERGLKRQVREVSKALQQIPQQRQAVGAFRQAEAAAEPQVKKYFPWLDDKSSADYQKAQEVLKAIPDLNQRTPLHRIVLGVYVLGLKQFEAMTNGAAGKAGATNGAARLAGALNKPALKAPPKPPAAGAAAPSAVRKNGSAAVEEAARQRFEKRPTAAGAAELIKIGLRG